MTTVLFICRQGEDSNITAYGYFRKFSGLFNSARLVNEMLIKNGISSDIETANDNNDIDRLVTKHKPEYCIIEAYWVVPEKFDVLVKLHPSIKWIIRIHSEVPFWATEGVATDWTIRYLDYPNVYLAPNAKRIFNDAKTVLSVKHDRNHISDRVVYLPNYYPADDRNVRTKGRKITDTIRIGCFGAIRPLKNQLIQALAAIQYADKNNLKLEFHINGNRLEGGGDPIIKNIRKLFEHATKHELIEHAWQPHSNFLDVVNDMDVGLQVSFTESFNIVAADLVTVGVPIVTSSEIPWINSIFYADPTDAKSIVDAIGRARFFGRFGVRVNQSLLDKSSRAAEKIWTNFFAGSVVKLDK